MTDEELAQSPKTGPAQADDRLGQVTSRLDEFENTLRSIERCVEAVRIELTALRQHAERKPWER